MSHRYVIYERSSGRRAMKVALWAVLLGAVAYLGSEYGRADAAADISNTTAERNALRQRTATLESENASLREQTASSLLRTGWVAHSRAHSESKPSGRSPITRAARSLARSASD